MLERILITGGAGFIGSNFVRHWCERTNEPICVLDKLSYAGNRSSLLQPVASGQVQLVEGDICDRTLVSQILQKSDIDTIVHFAAESHVDRSIVGPAAFIQTNVVGTFTLLEAFRDRWQAHHQPENYRFLHISTDEIYGSLEIDAPPFTENTPYAPNSPYSASKAGSNHLVSAYFHTYGLPTLITNCANNYGPYQFPEKLIPLMCVNILLGKPLPVYGDGRNVRDWLHVADHCVALEQVLRKAPPGSVYNIGGNSQVENINLVRELCDQMVELAEGLPYPPHDLITFVADRPGHDRRYAVDISKIQQEIGWAPTRSLKVGLRQTVEWYLQNRSWWQPLLKR
ncbi:dTDP-glucose 4,6-dehydratase [cf. Phormidesmis sp. LEGE 11477]|uniref:dTDP-glucose 4,6-dehydratase n=1 Tax=cf. Phormidesmis sp. LEGE 11477 TaxID=1828680 RepID=UPI00187E4921|nr:dTDP-glucose 4,6-dehydratase [cf. Phormidesmis sp. LEGE 11477]MBE9060530.1 dTDP-glucose 4,6-dehydratase [cf. Phormidesmis sp. LEGE 11477]